MLIEAQFIMSTCKAFCIRSAVFVLKLEVGSPRMSSISELEVITLDAMAFVAMRNKMPLWLTL